MYFFFGDGELGNQLFHFAFLKNKIKKNKLLITTNFHQLIKISSIDKNIKLLNFKNKYLVFFLRKIIIYIFIFFSQIKIINSINVKKKRIFGTIREENYIIEKKGIIPITFVYPCFFQSKFFFKNISNSSFRFKKKNILEAIKFLKKIPKKFNPVFVHIRQGKSYKEDLDARDALHYRDYQIIKFLGKKGIALPLQYYKNRIYWFKKNISNPYFIFLTDNVAFVEKNFSSLKDKVISKFAIAIDLQIMINCNYGIMSNSSISWWGGYLMKKRKIVFGTKYWLGWKRKIVFQAGGEPFFAKLIDPTIF
jgi:hypothetical protein